MNRTPLIFYLCILSVFSCSDRNDLSVLDDISVNNNVASVNVEITPMTNGDTDTRMALNFVEGNTQYTFAQSDTLGIFPSVGDQVSFPLSGSAGLTTASFNGGGWALKNGITYYAYMPFNRQNYLSYDAINSIPVSYIGQKQNASGSTADINNYIYQASVGTEVNNGKLSFMLKHIGALVDIWVKMPEIGKYNRISILADAPVFKVEGTVNLKSNSIEIAPTKYSNRIDLNINNIVFTEEDLSKTTIFYMMIPPTDCTDCNLSVILEKDNGVIYEAATRPNKSKNNFIASKYYGFDATFTTPSEPEYVSYEDSNFKSYMVSNFDKNGDGKISLAEAELVEDIDCSRSNQTRAWDGGAITSLSGIEYCTNLKTLICNNNEITNLDLTNNSALTTLFCADNNILNLNVVGCENITKINCSGNKLSSLDVSTNTSLVSLVCGGQTTVAVEELSIVVMVNEEQQERINTLIDDYSQSSITVELQTGLVSKASGNDFGNGGKF